MRKIWSLLLALALSLGLAAPACAEFLEQSDAFYVADYADVLSGDLEKDIYYTNYEELYKYCDGAEIVVVTVDNVGGMNTEDYAYKVFNEWGIGGKEDNGVLILLSIYDKKYFTMVGKNLMDDLDADVLYKLQDGAFETAFDNGDYDLAVETLFQGVLDVLRVKFAANYENAAPGEETAGSGFADFLGGVLMLIVFVMIVAAIVTAVAHSSPRPGGRPRIFFAPRIYPRYRPPRTGYRSSNSSWSGSSRPSSGSSFSGSFRGSSSGRSSFGGGRRGGGGGSSFGGGSGRR